MEFRPRDAFRSPRFAQVATFMRLPQVDDPAGLDVALLGVPFDGAVSYRPGPRFAPRDIRQHSVLVRPYNPALAVDPFRVLKVADAGDVDVDPLGFEQTFERVEEAVDRVLAAGAMPLCVGGDHFGEGSVSHFFLGFLLQQHGLSLADIVPVNMTAGDAGAAFVAGRVDAAVTWEPWLTRGKQAPHGHLLVDSSATPGLIVDALVFRKDVLRRREVEVRNVVRAWHRGVEYWKQHPEESNRIMAQAVGGWLKDPKVFAETLTGIRYYDYALNRAFFAPGGGIYKTAQFAIDFWARLGKVQVPGLRAADIVDGSFIAR